MPQLDGLRAIAVIAVWLQHWGFPPLRASRYLVQIEPGAMGVWLFFVLSGFLITGILLRSRAELEATCGSVADAAKIFYARRFIRILPAYYLALLLGTLLFPEVRQLFWWHFTYNTNFWNAFHPGQFPPGLHFWSLAVEEQFYLIWPWMILLVPSRHLFRAIVAVVAFSLLFRFGCTFLPRGHRGTPAYALLPGCADKLALGALLACFWDEKTGARLARWKDLFCRAGLWLGLPGAIGFIILRAYRPESRLSLVFLSFCAALFFVWVIGAAARGFSGPAGAFLEWQPIRYLGKISYGLYLYHYLTREILRRCHVAEPHSWSARFALFSAITIFIASASWFAFESPVNRMKRFFKYAALRPAQMAHLLQLHAQTCRE
jgi:peptidoglycan/LPS O-acetylase OafA/YrhL